jgi:hypothetical protein
MANPLNGAIIHRMIALFRLAPVARPPSGLRPSKFVPDEFVTRGREVEL